MICLSGASEGFGLAYAAPNAPRRCSDRPKQRRRCPRISPQACATTSSRSSSARACLTTPSPSSSRGQCSPSTTQPPRRAAPRLPPWRSSSSWASFWARPPSAASRARSPRSRSRRCASASGPTRRWSRPRCPLPSRGPPVCRSGGLHRRTSSRLTLQVCSAHASRLYIGGSLRLGGARPLGDRLDPLLRDGHGDVRAAQPQPRRGDAHQRLLRCARQGLGGLRLRLPRHGPPRFPHLLAPHPLAAHDRRARRLPRRPPARLPAAPARHAAATRAPG